MAQQNYNYTDSPDKSNGTLNPNMNKINKEIMSSLSSNGNVKQHQQYQQPPQQQQQPQQQHQPQQQQQQQQQSQQQQQQEIINNESLNSQSSESAPNVNTLQNGLKNNNNSMHNRNNNNDNGFVSHSENYANQMSNVRQSMMMQHAQSKQPDDYDPDSNVYVANLPSDYGKERLYNLFGTYGQIVRYKFVTPDEPQQPGYGFVQFQSRKDAHTAIQNLENHTFPTGEVIYLSIALRRRSSLSDEPTNLYVKNLPSSWTNDKLRDVFGVYGQIRQSKVVGDGIAFVRFEDHDQALNAISRLDKQQVEQGLKLEVRFATRKTAANAYRLQQIPPTTKSNENNLYVRNLPKFYSQSNLEDLFMQFGKISSAKINDNGIAFVRFAHSEDAKRTIQELNGTKPDGFDEEIVVKLAHFDIGDSRNRWSQKFGQNNNNNTTPQPFNSAVYNNHFNHPPMNQHMNPYNNYNNHNSSNTNNSNNQHHHHHQQHHLNNTTQQQHIHHHNNNNSNNNNISNNNLNNHLSSIPTSTASFGHDNTGHGNQDLNVNVNISRMTATSTNPISNVSAITSIPSIIQPTSNPAITSTHNVSTTSVNTTPNPVTMQMQQLQQQMQQWQLQQHTNKSSANTHQQQQAAVSQTQQFGFPQNGVLIPAPTFTTQTLLPNTSIISNVSNNNLPRQSSNESGTQSPGSNHSGSQHSCGSNDKRKLSTFTKKQQQLGDVLYQKVYAKCGQAFAPKITGMLIKMGDQKAQQYIDDPNLLDEQIKIAKNLLQTQQNGNLEGTSSSIDQSCSATNPLINRLNGGLNGLNGHFTVNIGHGQQNGTPPTNPRYQHLNTKPMSPNPNQNTLSAQHQIQNPVQTINPSSIPNLLINASIPNTSIYQLQNGNMALLTPSLLQMSPAPSTNTQNSNTTNNINLSVSNSNTNTNANKSPIVGIEVPNGVPINNTSIPNQYLFTTNLLNSNPNTINVPRLFHPTSPAAQYTVYNTVGTPNSLNNSNIDNTQQHIAQNGWGLANNNNTQPQQITNIIQTQPQTQFIQPAIYRPIQ